MFDPATVPWRPTRHRGIHIHTLRRDDLTKDAAVLIRMEPACSYPPHRHSGPEEVFIIQGGYRDQDGEHSAGDYCHYKAASSHQPTALEGEDCILFAVAHQGIELLG